MPLITVLFMASVMLPLFLPQGVTFDKLLRALIGVALFAAAYMAEVVRGGLQAMPKGQYEAASALGLGYWQTTGLIVLPQALKLVIPGIVNTFIGLFKDTSLVLIIGLFDLLGIAQLVIKDPAWLGLDAETYLSSPPSASGSSASACRATRCGRAAARHRAQDADPSAVAHGAERIACRPTATAIPSIELRDVHKWYGEFHVLRDINLDGQQGASRSSSAVRRAPASRR